MKFKLIYITFNAYDKFTIISEFIKAHSTEEFMDVPATEPCKFPLI